MTRWMKTCDLVEKVYTIDSEGVPQAEDVRTTVFCNEFSTGALTWSSMYEIGISVDAEIEIWRSEYSGQRDVFFDGVWYSVEKVSPEKRHGEDYLRLYLRHQKSDSEDHYESGESNGA